MATIYFLLLLAALICFICAATDRIKLPSRINPVALGLAFWVTVPLVETIRSLS